MNADDCPAPAAATAYVFALHVGFRPHRLQVPEISDKAAMVFVAVAFVKLLQPGTGKLVAFVAEA